MTQHPKYFAAVLAAVIVFFMSAGHSLSNPAEPVTNQGKKWRIGYLEGGSYANYPSILKEMILNLMETGWIEPESLPPCRDASDSLTLWTFLSKQAKSRFLEFSPAAYWSLNWDAETRKKSVPAIIKRLQEKKDIDLMLAFGTWAGQDLANNRHSTPTMVISASNAVQSGIIKSVTDSGFDHVHAWIDPDKTERQLRLFHEIIRFRKLGIAYEDDSDGRSYAGLADVLKLSARLGFEVIECRIPVETGPDDETRELIRCHETLAPEIDAMYITDYAGLTEKSISKLLAPFFKYKVPTCAQARYDLVKNGILIGAERSDFTADAEFYTGTLVKILHGARPGDLPQKFETPLDTVVNLECARKIGFRIPLDVLAGAFEVHDRIEPPGKE